MRTKLKPAQTTLGRRLRDARMHRGLTQDELGVGIGLDEGNACIRISRYETGQVTPPFGVLEQLSRVLRVPLSFFVAETNQLAALSLQIAQLSEAELEALCKQVTNTLKSRNPN